MDLRVHNRFDSEPMDFSKGPEDRSELVHYDQFAVHDRYDSVPIDYNLGPPESSKLDQNGNLGNYETTEQSLPINFSRKALDSYELIQYEPNVNKRNAAVIEHVEKSSKAIQNVQIQPLVSAPLSSFQAALLILQDQAKTKLRLQAHLESGRWLIPVNTQWSIELVKISGN